MLAMNATCEQVPANPVYWGLPVAGFFQKGNTPEIFFAGHSMTGLVQPNGNLVWWDALDKSGFCLPAFGDFAGDGHIRAIGIGYEDGIRCYDAATGKIKWRMTLLEAGTPTGTASADLDADGRDEALTVIGHNLYCLGETVAGKGTLRWKVKFPCAVGPPAIADVDKSGSASV